MIGDGSICAHDASPHADAQLPPCMAYQDRIVGVSMDTVAPNFLSTDHAMEWAAMRIAENNRGSPNPLTARARGDGVIRNGIVGR